MNEAAIKTMVYCQKCAVGGSIREDREWNDIDREFEIPVERGSGKNGGSQLSHQYGFKRLKLSTRSREKPHSCSGTVKPIPQ